MRNLCLFIMISILTCSCSESKKAITTVSNPQRIISLAPAITQKLYLLGADNRLIANTVYCQTPDEAKLKTKIGNVTQANIEMIVSLKPDLVIASRLTKPEQAQKLMNMGISVATAPNSESFNALCEDFISLGQLVGAGERAKLIVEQARKEVDAIQKRTAGLPKKRVFVQIGAKPLFAVTRKYFVNDYIVLAGGENVAGNEKSGIYSREKVVEDDPDVIIITTMGMVGDEEKKVWFNYPSITAVKNNDIHVIDSYRICSPTPVTFVETLNEIVGILHPEINDKK